MRAAQCNAPVRGHSDPAAAAKCPLHGRVVAVRAAAMPNVAPVPNPRPIGVDDIMNFMDGDFKATDPYRETPLVGGARPTRGLRITGRLTVDSGATAYDCVAGWAITVEGGGSVDGCHVVDIEHEGKRFAQWLDVEGAGEALNSTAGYISVQGGSEDADTHVDNCHSRGNINVSGDNLAVTNCTAEGAFIIKTYGDDWKVDISDPGQILVNDGPGDDDFLRGVTYPPETTFVVDRDHPWHYALSGDVPGAGLGWAGDAETVHDKLRPWIALCRQIVTRPQNGSQGAFVDARNDAAWAQVREHAVSDADGNLSIDEDLLRLIVATNRNP